MAKQKAKSKLGKGLASLIAANTSAPTTTEEFFSSTSNNIQEPETEVKKALREKAEKKKEEKKKEELPSGQPYMVDVESISVNEYQPRKIFKEKDILELSLSIKENGIIQPIVVTQVDNKFEIISGERRWRAAKAAGLEQVPVIIKRATDREKLVLAIIENVQRSDLNCIEEALAYYQLMDEFQLTQEEVAKKIGKERSTIANFLRLLKLPREVIELLQKELLTFGHGKVLAVEKDEIKVTRLAHEAVTKKYSVRQLEQIIKKKNTPAKEKQTRNPFFDEKLDNIKNQLEKRTGFHFGVASKGNGVGSVTIKFNDEAEFNDIIEYLLGD